MKAGESETGRGHLDGRRAPPRFGPNDLLIKIRKTAICGTDVHIYKWDDWAQETIPVPMVDHEFMGEVVDKRPSGWLCGRRPGFW